MPSTRAPAPTAAASGPAPRPVGTRPGCRVEAAYLDWSATAPLRPEARAAWLAWSSHVGNPTGAHRAGREARRALDDARDVLAVFLGCGPGDVVFTGGGTEADNLAIVGTVVGQDGGQVVSGQWERSGPVCSAFEHHAVLDPVLARGGRVVGVGAEGTVDLDALASVLDPTVGLVSVMTVNNEVGTVQPLDEVADIVAARSPGARFHTDAVAAACWLDLAAVTARADLVSVSAHKFGGPQGVGALAVKHGCTVRAQLLGGGQERDRRSGTQNVAGIVAMAAAAQVTMAERDTVGPDVERRRDRLLDRLITESDGVHETVPRSRKVPGNAHVCVDGVEGEALLFLLDGAGVAASAASSCASGAQQRSHVLTALGVPPRRADGAVRFSLGWATTDAEVDHAADAFAAAVRRLRDAGVLPR